MVYREHPGPPTGLSKAACETTWPIEDFMVHHLILRRQSAIQTWLWQTSCYSNRSMEDRIAHKMFTEGILYCQLIYERRPLPPACLWKTSWAIGWSTEGSWSIENILSHQLTYGTSWVNKIDRKSQSVGLWKTYCLDLVIYRRRTLLTAWSMEKMLFLPVCLGQLVYGKSCSGQIVNESQQTNLLKNPYSAARIWI